MTDAAQKSTSSSPGPGTSPAEEPQGSLGAVLLGGAILLIAGLLIFWPGSDTAKQSGAGGKGGRGDVQAANGVDGDAAGGQARGIAPRQVDPVPDRPPPPSVRPGLLAPTGEMAMLPTPPPEPTSFPTPAAELAHLEKKLVEARHNLEARTTFLDRMKRIMQEAPISEYERNAARAKIVQDNYDKAQSRVDDIEYRIKVLRKQQAGG